MAAASMSMDPCPDDFKCSISLGVMVDPTMLVQSGHTYERTEIEMALATRPNRDPKTNVTFQGEPMLVANHALRGSIAQWISRRSSSGGVFRVGPRPAAPPSKLRSKPTPTVPLGSEEFKYEGEYKDGKWEGQGTVWFAEGEVYEGECKDGKREGRGTVWLADGTVYEGEWKNAKCERQGTYWRNDGSVYGGEWKDGKREGRGTYWWNDGEVYVGEYKDGKREGRGTYWWDNGEVDVGEWKAGELVGDGLRWSKDQKTTWLLKDGEIVREIGRDGLADAKAIARLMAFSDIPQ